MNRLRISRARLAGWLAGYAGKGWKGLDGSKWGGRKKKRDRIGQDGMALFAFAGWARSTPYS